MTARNCAGALSMLGVCLAFSSPPAVRAAQPISQRQNRIRTLIKKKVHSTMGKSNHIAIGSTRALKDMPACPAPPSIALYGHGAYRDARVGCDTQGWQLYIPVKISKARRIVVATKDLAAGKVLSAADVKLLPAGQLAGAAGDAHTLAAVIGQTLRAPVSSGTPIALAALQAPLRVHAGDSLSVHVRSDAVSLKTTAIALQAGRDGQSILVKNPASGKRYRVKITATGAVLNLTW